MTRRTFISISAVASLLSVIGKAQPAVRFNPPSRPKPFDRELMLKCIAEIESGNNDAMIGPVGERSKYQISYAVWLQHTDGTLAGRRSFEQCCHTVLADALATKHLNWIMRSVGTNSFAIVASWHLGVEGSKRRWTAHARDHINRTVRLFQERSRT